MTLIGRLAILRFNIDSTPRKTMRRKTRKWIKRCRRLFAPSKAARQRSGASSTQLDYPASKSNAHCSHWRSRSFSFETAKASERPEGRRCRAAGNADHAIAAAMFSK
jgi:hypothetical protein